MKDIDINRLLTYINHYGWAAKKAYYVDAKPIMSDEHYDRMEKFAKEMFQKYNYNNPSNKLFTEEVGYGNP